LVEADTQITMSTILRS